MEEKNTSQLFLDVESFSPARLLELAEENFTKVNYSDAEYYYTLCIQKDSSNEEAISQYAECLKVQGKFEQSIEVLKEAVARRAGYPADQPDDYRKYFQLGELVNGQDSLDLYEKGILIIKENIQKGILSETDKEVKRDLSEAYSGMAETYQTDFLHLPESEPKVIAAIQAAIQADPTSLDAFLQQTNYYLNKENEDEAKKSLKIVMDGLLSLDQETDTYDDSFKLNASKLCIEVEEYNTQIPILEQLVLSNDSNYDAFYLLAFCHFKIGNYYTGLEYTETLLAKKDLEQDEEIFSATHELKDELDKQDFKTAKDGAEYEQGDKKEGEEEEDEEEEWMDLE